VRDLHWTVLDLSHCRAEEWEDPKLARELDERLKLSHDRESPSEAIVDGVYRYDLDYAAHQARAEALWQTFRSMVNVSSVDICYLLYV
jgi:hypothetical protein